MTKGTLTIVGTGIKHEAHMTAEARTTIQQAEKVFFLTNNEYMEATIRALNPAAENLAQLYQAGKQRLATYKQMVDRMLTAVRQGQQVCGVFYGHPGIFVYPANKAMRMALAEGFTAVMQPGISAEDCLFADLGVDPAQYGCQSYEATDFLVRPRHFDISTNLILWQIGVVGNLLTPTAEDKLPGLTMLIDKLVVHYGREHIVYIYEAAADPTDTPSIQQGELQHVTNARVTPISTLYIPPQHEPDVDMEMMAQLGFTVEGDEIHLD